MTIWIGLAIWLYELDGWLNWLEPMYVDELISDMDSM